jgi:hypothetical protein
MRRNFDAFVALTSKIGWKTDYNLRFSETLPGDLHAALIAAAADRRLVRPPWSIFLQKRTQQSVDRRPLGNDAIKHLVVRPGAR